MQMKKGWRLMLLALLASQYFLTPYSVIAQTTQGSEEASSLEISETEANEISTEPKLSAESEVSLDNLREVFEGNSSDNPAFQAGLEVYWQFFESDTLNIRDVAELDGSGSSVEEVMEALETEVEPKQITQDEQTTYLLYEFKVQDGEQGSEHHLAEIIAIFKEDHLDYVGLSSVTVTFPFEDVLSEEEAIAYSEPGTSFEALMSLEPVFVGIGYNRFKGENYVSVSFPSFTGEDEVMYEFSLFNEAEEVIYNYIVNAESRHSQPSSYLYSLSLEYFYTVSDREDQEQDDSDPTTNSTPNPSNDD